MMARKIVVVFGLIVACLGLAIVAAPTTLVEGAQLVLSPAGIAIAGSGRIAIGIILWLASDESRTPRTFKVIGVLAVLGGIMIFIMGVPGLTSLVEWGTSNSAFLRLPGVIAAGLGGFLAWSAMTRKKAL
jgi:hypothetical protein